MMGLFKKLTRSLLTIAEIPLAIVKDVTTMGGTLTDQDKTYTTQKIKEAAKDYEEFKDELSK